MRRRMLGASLALAAGALALVAAWHTAPATTPPLYDGVCTADPYQLLGGSPGPSSASKQYPAAAAGAFQTSEVVTNENPPQAQALMTDGTFVSPEAFTFSITAVRVQAAAPAREAIDGNVYRMLATTTGGAQLEPVDTGHPVTVLLRAEASNPARTMARLDGSRWVPLKTFLVGCGDTFEATSPQLGDFALLRPAGAASSSGLPSSGGTPVAVLAAAGTALVLIVVLVAIRVLRSRAT